MNNSIALNTDRLILLIPININCSQHKFNQTAVQLVNTYGGSVFRHIDYDTCMNSSLLCATLSVLVQSEGIAARIYADRDTNPFSSSHHIASEYVEHLLNFLRSSRNKSLKSSTLTTLISDLFDRQDNILHDLKTPFRQRHQTHMAAVALYNGIYVGHVYLYTRNLQDIRMIGIRKSLSGYMIDAGSVSYTILRGLQQYAYIHYFKNIIIDGVPIGAMSHVANKCGFIEYDKGYIVSVRQLGTVLKDMQMISISDMGCRTKKRALVTKLMTNKWFTPIMDDNMRREVLSYLVYITLPDTDLIEKTFDRNYTETTNPPLGYIFNAMYTLKVEEHRNIVICEKYPPDIYDGTDYDDISNDIYSMFCGRIREDVWYAYTDVNKQHVWGKLQERWVMNRMIISGTSYTHTHDNDVEGLDDDID